MAESLKNLAFNRGHVRRKVTIVHKEVTDKLDSFSSSQKLASTNKIKSLLDELKALDKKILFLKWNESNEENENKQKEEMDSCAEYEEKAYEAMGMLELSLQQTLPSPGFENTSAPPLVSLELPPHRCLRTVVVTRRTLRSFFLILNLSLIITLIPITKSSSYFGARHRVGQRL